MFTIDWERRQATFPQSATSVTWCEHTSGVDSGLLQNLLRRRRRYLHAQLAQRQKP